MLLSLFIQRLYSISNQIRVTIVIDAFRAFATGSYVLERRPATYMIATKSTTISRLALNFQHPLIIGKPEKGSNLMYDIPNSPTRVKGVTVTGRNVLHRTEAGAKGILLARQADIVLAAGFVNANATATYIKTLTNPNVTIIPMGHEANLPSLEDDICADYLRALIRGKKIKLTPFIPALKEGPGRYFFTDDQWQYPREDFDRCLKVDRFPFTIRALPYDDYAVLISCS